MNPPAPLTSLQFLRPDRRGPTYSIPGSYTVGRDFADRRRNVGWEAEECNGDIKKVTNMLLTEDCSAMLPSAGLCKKLSTFSRQVTAPSITKVALLGVRFDGARASPCQW